MMLIKILSPVCTVFSRLIGEKEIYSPRGNFMSNPAKDDKGTSTNFLENGIIFLSDEEDDQEEDPVTEQLKPKSPRQNINLQGPQIFNLDTDSEERDALENKSVREYFSENSAFLSENKVDDEEKEPVTERLTPKSPRGNVNLQGPQRYMDINSEEKDTLENKRMNEYFSANSIFLSEDEVDDEEKEPVTEGLTPSSARGNVNFQGPQIFEVDIDSEGKDALVNKSMNEYFCENSIFLSEDEIDDEEKEPVTERLTPRSARSNVNFQGPLIFELDIDSEEKDALENKSIREYFSENSAFLSENKVDDEEKEPVTGRLTPRSARGNVNFQGPLIFELDIDSEEKDALENKSIREYFSENSAFLSENKVDDEEKEPVTERLTPRSARGNVNFQGPQIFEVDIDSEGKDALENKRINEYFSTNSIFLSDDEENEPFTERMTPTSPRRNVDLHGTQNVHLLGNIGKVEIPNTPIKRSEKYDDDVDNSPDENIYGTPLPNPYNVLANESLEYSAEYGVVSSIDSQEHINTDDKGTCTFNMRSLKDKLHSKLKEIRSSYFPNDMKRKGGFFQCVTTFTVSRNCSCVSSLVEYDHGQCWVADQESTDVVLCDRAGNLKDSVDVGCPVDSLTIDKDGNLYMSCPDKKQVRVFDRNRHVKTFQDMTQYPRGLAYSQKDDSLLVCRNNNRIANDLNTKACNPLRKYPIHGSKVRRPRPKDLDDGRFGYPIRVCVNVNDDCVVSDFAHRSITVLDHTGRIRFSFKSSKDFPIRNHHSICCDNKGNIYIFSKGKPNVCVLESDGNVKDIFTCQDLFNEFVYASVFDSEGYLWVACMDGLIKIFKTT